VGDLRRGATKTPNAVVAAAAVLSDRQLPTRKPDSWQDEAWGYYESVGELRYAITYMANALSRCQLVAATPGTSSAPTPVPLDAGPAVEAMARLAGGTLGQSQMLAGFGVNLSVPGIAYLIGDTNAVTGVETWIVYAQDAIRTTPGGGGYQIQVGDAAWVDVSPEALVVQCWRPSRRRLWEPDSPVKAVLPVLRQISLLDARIGADATSRLAGAGILVVPTEATFPRRRPDDPEEDPFIDALMEAMTVPIQNRESAAAVVPFVVRLPGDLCDKVIHLKLSTEFDAKILDLRESAIRRLAIGLDLPAEAVLGVGDLNHWSAWQVEESAIKIHVEPMMEVICDALTIGYLAPALAAMGEDPSSAVVWYDAADLRVRPDRSTTSVSLYDRALLSPDATLRENGFDSADVPTPPEVVRLILVSLALNHPDLIPTVMPYLDDVVTGRVPAVRVVVPAQPSAPQVGPGGGPGAPPAAPAPGAPPPAPTVGPPPSGPPSAPGPPGALPPASARPPSLPDALLAACDGLVERALEHAGNRLRRKAGITGSDCPPIQAHTCVPAGTLDAVGLDSALTGAWSRVPEIAARYGAEAEGLRSWLDGYTRSLLASGTPHSYAVLCEAFGYSLVR
jgi:hypothetical protein